MKIQNTSTTIADGLQKKIELFHSLKEEFLSNTSFKNNYEELYRNILTVLNKASETYTVCGEEVPRDEIPRDASMVGGPSFVSEKYPQPIDSKGVEMFPVLQIDLEWLGRVTNQRFTSEILQLWWSSNDTDGGIVMIPKTEINLSLALPISISDEVNESARDWVPYHWICSNKVNAYLLTKSVNIGITYPEFIDLVDAYEYEASDDVASKETLKFIRKICVADQFNVSEFDVENAVFNLFGYYRSHSCAAWEVESDRCFLHTSGWSSGLMDANIFMKTDGQGVFSGYNFGFGR